MRMKHTLGFALCLVVAIVPAGAAFGATAIQTIDAELGGKATPKFDKKTFKKTSIAVETTTTDSANPAGGAAEGDHGVDQVRLQGHRSSTPPRSPGCTATQISGTTH